MIYTLPCFKWISTGCCPYLDKCMYIHPESFKNKYNDTICIKNDKKKHERDLYPDSFFYHPCDSKNNTEYFKDIFFILKIDYKSLKI